MEPQTAIPDAVRLPVYTRVLLKGARASLVVDCPTRAQALPIEQCAHCPRCQEISAKRGAGSAAVICCPEPASHPAPGEARGPSPLSHLQQENEAITGALWLLEQQNQRLQAGQLISRESIGWLVDFFSLLVHRCHQQKLATHLLPALLPYLQPQGAERLQAVGEAYREAQALLALLTPGEPDLAILLEEYAPRLHALLDQERQVLSLPLEEVLSPGERQALLEALGREEEALGAGVYQRLIAQPSP